jgi:hypothetical protein
VASVGRTLIAHTMHEPSVRSEVSEAAAARY